MNLNFIRKARLHERVARVAGRPHRGGVGGVGVTLISFLYYVEFK